MADKGVIRQKAHNAQLIYDDLLGRLDMKPIPTTFVADEDRHGHALARLLHRQPLPRPSERGAYKAEDTRGSEALSGRDHPPDQRDSRGARRVQLRGDGDRRAAAGDDVSGAQIRCDLVFAGLQAIRLYMSDHKHCKEFTRFTCAVGACA